MLNERERRQWGELEQRLRPDRRKTARRWDIELTVTVAAGWWLLALVLAWWFTLAITLTAATVLTVITVHIGVALHRRGVSRADCE